MTLLIPYSTYVLMSTLTTRLFTSQRAARVHRSDEGALSKSRDTRVMSL